MFPVSRLTRSYVRKISRCAEVTYFLLGFVQSRSLYLERLCYSRQIETSTAQSWNEIYFGCFWIDGPNAQSKRVRVECVELYPGAFPMSVSGLITTEHKNPAIWVLSVLQRRTTGLANAPAFLINDYRFDDCLDA